jgi:DNA-binding LacI/PurR family transcriptional regulator
VLAAGAVGFVSGQKGRRSLDRFLMQIGNIPVLTISGDAKDIPNVRYDNATGIISGIEYLIGEQGCRKITFVAGPKENPDSDEREGLHVRDGRPRT